MLGLEANWTNVLLGAIFVQQGIFYTVTVIRRKRQVSLCQCERCQKKRHH